MFGHQITNQMILLDWSPEQFGEICGVRFQWSTILTGCESWNKNWFLHSSSTKRKNDIIILLCDIRSPPFPVVMSFSHLLNCFCRCWRSTCCWWPCCSRSTCCWWPCPTRLRGSLPWKILMVREWTDWPRLYSLNHERNGRCVWETSRLRTIAKVIIGYYAKSKFWHVALGSPK